MKRQLLGLLLIIILGAIYSYILSIAFLLLGSLSTVPEYVSNILFLSFVVIQIIILLNRKLDLKIKLLFQLVLFVFYIIVFYMVY